MTNGRCANGRWLLALEAASWALSVAGEAALATFGLGADTERLQAGTIGSKQQGKKKLKWQDGKCIL